MCVPEYVLITMLLHVIMFLVPVLEGLSVSLHLLTNGIPKKQGKDEVYTLVAAYIFVNCCVIVDKTDNTQLASVIWTLKAFTGALALKLASIKDM